MYEVKPAVPAISVGVVNPTFVELCHFVTVPVLPLKVKAATDEPLQIVWLELTEPPTDEGVTVTVNGLAVSAGQEPDVTTAL